MASSARGRRKIRFPNMSQLLLALLFVILPALCWGACSGSSPNRTAASASQTDVNDCITAATTGDTINVPAGSATWTSLSLPSNKDLRLKGASTITCSGTPGSSGYSCSAGATNTTITCSGSCVVLNLAASHTVTGFKFSGDGNMVDVTGNQNASKHFSIHHNVITASPAGWTPMRLFGGDNGVHPQGIWHHNRLEQGAAIHTNGTNCQLDDPCADAQHQIWAEDTPLGDSSKVVYIEANYFVTTTATTNFSDGNYGMRVVHRFNTMSGPSIAGFEYHSPQGQNRGTQRWETYNNHFIDLDAADSCFFGMASLRGGTGVWFNNAMTGSVSGCNQSISLDNVRSPIGWNNGPEGGCGSSSAWDQNTVGQNGWHCRDQIGISRDLTQWDHSPEGAWNQETKPAYLWGNTRTGSSVTADVDSEQYNPTHIQANRDYYDHSTATGSPQTVGVRTGVIANRPAGCTAGVAYWATDEGDWNGYVGAAQGRLYKCTATDIWTLYYTPYKYPHPWAVRDGPAPPSNLRQAWLDEVFGTGEIAARVMSR